MHRKPTVPDVTLAVAVAAEPATAVHLVLTAKVTADEAGSTVAAQETLQAPHWAQQGSDMLHTSTTSVASPKSANANTPWCNQSVTTTSTVILMKNPMTQNHTRFPHRRPRVPRPWLTPTTTLTTTISPRPQATQPTT